MKTLRHDKDGNQQNVINLDGPIDDQEPARLTKEFSYSGVGIIGLGLYEIPNNPY
jgi:hypothetical protein